jgi:5-methylcytosine-specific restriction endonuclease McrA
MRSWRTPRLVRCYWCGKKSRGNACHGDHIIALSDGGAHSLENLCISCSTCNMKKHDKPLSIWNQQIVEPVLL